MFQPDIPFQSIPNYSRVLGDSPQARGLDMVTAGECSVPSSNSRAQASAHRNLQQRADDGRSFVEYRMRIVEEEAFSCMGWLEAYNG